MIVLYYTYVLHTEWEHAIKKKIQTCLEPQRGYHTEIENTIRKREKKKKNQTKNPKASQGRCGAWVDSRIFLERREKRLANKKITHTTYETIFGIRVTPVMKVGQKKMKPRVDRPLFFMTILKS